jgi:excisionase family DNA binding protein
MIRFPRRDNPNKYPNMSSNLRIVKICAFCKQEVIAKKTTTETCSDPCAKRLYKVKQRDKAISRAVAETMVKRKPQAFVTEDEVKAIQAKEWLTLVEAALLLNVSPLTLRRWTLAGKVKSQKVGRKHMFRKTDLRKIPCKHLLWQYTFFLS